MNIKEKIKELIDRIDPNRIKCPDCHQWFDKKDCTYYDKWYCNTCAEKHNPYATIATPLIRRVFPALIANDIVGIQPMSGLVGKVFYLRDKYIQKGVKCKKSKQKKVKL